MGTIGQRYFVKIVELIAKEKDAVEAFFDQITTAAWNVLEPLIPETIVELTATTATKVLC